MSTPAAAPVGAELPVANPFPGPQAYTSDERTWFFGRDDEIERLTALALSTSATLLYAPSGTGKSSLLQAGVVPHLRDNHGFAVLPTVHLGTGARAERTDGTNPFTRAVCETVTDGATDLAEALARHRPADEFGCALLVLDQFEEVFTDEELWEERTEFFFALSRVLGENTWLRLIIALRSDYLAELVPYERFLPGRLAVRFRLAPLTERAATEAVRAAFDATDVTLPPSDLTTLMDLLLLDRKRRVRSRHVNTIQLQIVCRQLWERLREQGTPVRPVLSQDTTASLTESMVQFVDGAIAKVVAHGHREEKAIRWWLSGLITPTGRRAFVQVNEEETAGLPNQILRELAGVKLVQVEQRQGSRLAELAHDSMTDGVRASNDAWLKTRSTKRLRRSALLFVVLVLLLGAYPLLTVDEGADVLTQKTGDLGPGIVRVPFQGKGEAVAVAVQFATAVNVVSSLTVSVQRRGGADNTTVAQRHVDGATMGTFVALGARTAPDQSYEVVLYSGDPVTYDLRVMDLPLVRGVRADGVASSWVGVPLPVGKPQMLSVVGGTITGAQAATHFAGTGQWTAVEGTAEDPLAVLHLAGDEFSGPPPSATVRRTPLPAARPIDEDGRTELTFEQGQVVSLSVDDTGTPMGIEGRCDHQVSVDVLASDTSGDSSGLLTVDLTGDVLTLVPEPGVLPMRLRPGKHELLLTDALVGQAGPTTCTVRIRSFPHGAVTAFGVREIPLSTEKTWSAVAVRLPQDAVITTRVPRGVEVRLSCENQQEGASVNEAGRLLAYVTRDAKCGLWWNSATSPQAEPVRLSVLLAPPEEG